MWLDDWLFLSGGVTAPPIAGTVYLDRPSLGVSYLDGAQLTTGPLLVLPTVRRPEMATPFEKDFGRVLEGASVRLGGTLRDAAGDAVSALTLDTVKLWVYDRKTRQVQGGFNGTDIKASVDTNGALAHLLPASALVLVRNGGEEEKVLLVRWTYNGGSDSGAFRFLVTVVQDPLT
jgi:hypothetical protein